jgi:hypothetical protein
MKQRLFQNRILTSKEAWDNIQIGDLLQTEYNDGKRDVFLVREKNDHSITTIQVRTGYEKVIDRQSSTCSKFWL